MRIEDRGSWVDRESWIADRGSWIAAALLLSSSLGLPPLQRHFIAQHLASIVDRSPAGPLAACR